VGGRTDLSDIDSSGNHVVRTVGLAVHLRERGTDLGGNETRGAARRPTHQTDEGKTREGDLILAMQGTETPHGPSLKKQILG